MASARIKQGPTSMQEGLDSLRQECLHDVNRVVVKVGSAVLAGEGQLRRKAVARLAADLAAVRRGGVDTVLVSSGAVASGFRRLGTQRIPTNITKKQAAAAIGQPLLMAEYTRAFAQYRTHVGQVLLTADDLDHRPRYLNARHTLGSLLRHGILPIINENDSISTDEIKIGDNDHLSALVANLVSADLLIMLTNVDGIYRSGDSRDVVSVVPAGRCPMEHVEPARRSATGTGGMATKVQAAKLAGRWGVPTIVAGGKRERVVQRIVLGEPLGTFFAPTRRKLSARKLWLAMTMRLAGTLVIDEGACNAIIKRRASLLPSGVCKTEGGFARGAQVQIVDRNGDIVGRGLTTYSAAEIDQIRGRRSNEIARTLGYTYGGEVVHRDDLVLMPAGDGE